MKLIKLTATVLLIFSASLYADNSLDENQIKELFTNKTFTVKNVENDRTMKGYDDANGEHLIYLPKKDKLFKRKWWTDGNKHCTSNPKRGDSCKTLVDMGNGVYNGYTDGKHTHVLSEFQEGNHLKD